MMIGGFLLILITSPSVFSQSHGRIVGRVSDPTGAVLRGARVTLRNAMTGTRQATITDETGRYEFAGLSVGIYSLNVRAPGFSNAQRTVSLAEPGAEIEINFKLIPGSITEVITVTATREEQDTLAVPVRVATVTMETLRRENPTTMGDALLTLPNIVPVNSGPYLVRPRLRGLDSTRLILMVDGERLNTTRMATGIAGPEIGLVDPAEVKAVEVVYGSGSALYGTDALSGTINVITKMPEPANQGLHIGGGFTGFFSSNEVGRRGTIHIDVSGRTFAIRGSLMLERYPNYHAGKPFNETSEPVVVPITVFSDTEDKEPQLLKPPPGRVVHRMFFGLIPDLFNQPFTRVSSKILNSQSHGSNVNVTTRVFPSRTHALRLRLVQRRTRLTGFPDITPPFFFQTINLPFSDLDKVSLRYEGTGVTPWLAHLSAGGYWQEQDRLLQNDISVMGVRASDVPDWDTLTRVGILSRTRQNVKSFGFHAHVSLLFGTKNRLTTGVDYFRDHSRDSRLTRVDVTIIGAGNRATGTFFPLNAPIVTGAVSHPQRVPIANFQNMALFLEDEYDPVWWLRVMGSLRIDRIDVDTVPTPGYEPRIPNSDPPLDPSTFPSPLGVRIDRTAVTGNLGLAIRPSPPMSFMIRVGRSFRHPNLVELFFFGPGTIGGPIVPNTKVRPETGINVDVGIKLRTSHLASEFTYFNNMFRNFISTEFVAVTRNDPEFDDGQPISQAGNFFPRLRIEGIEASWKVPFSFHETLFTWFGHLSYLRGQILRGKAVLRTETGIETVDVSDHPADDITPFKSVLGLRWNDKANRFWWEYRIRSQTHIRRVSPLLLDSPFLTPQDLFSLNGFSVHTWRGGYHFQRERYTMDITVGLENLGNKFYREQFQFAPARGRRFTVGLRVKFF